MLCAEQQSMGTDFQGNPNVTGNTRRREQSTVLGRETFASSRQLLGLVIIIIILLGRTG